MSADVESQLRHIDGLFDPRNAESSCLHILHAISPQWAVLDSQDVTLHRFTDGITNTLIKASRKQPGSSEADSDLAPVLIRAYGSGTSTMIDREKELRSHALLASKGMASSLLARFDNGFVYDFVPGDPCEAQDFHDPRTSREIAKRLGEWHGRLPISALADTASLEHPNNYADDGVVPNIWTNATNWINLLPSHTTDLHSRNDNFRKELAWLSAQFSDLPGLQGRNLVFSHTDLLCANVILKQMSAETGQTRPVTFIDYEYATAAPAAFDIANVFAEWAGPDGELSWMPSRTQRLDFIKHYVTSFREHSNVPEVAVATDPEDDVSQLYQQVQLCRGLPGFYWGVWGLIQASISDIDFDYVAYAERRHSEYWGWKAEFDGSRERGGRERTVREQAWAKE